MRRAPVSPAVSGRARLLVTRAADAEGKAPETRTRDAKTSKKAKDANVYGHTVLLPKTDFDMRANSVTKEPNIQQWWTENQIYETIRSRDAEMFTLHDGPPYANGDLHIGHALNKILKDFINRYEALKGKRVQFVPGWDCHGLPIELKVLQSMDAETRIGLLPIDLRRKAKRFALKTVDRQREQFKRYGVWADWEEPYLTLLPEYEAAQLEVFGEMFLNGHIYRGKKPVHWSPSSMTALAEAELEYPEGHVSQSVYAAFPVSAVGGGGSKDFPGEHVEALESASLAIWTTTPWTLPANAAIAVNDALDYALVRVVEAKDRSANDSQSKDSQSFLGATLVLAAGATEAAAAKWNVGLETIVTFKGKVLEGVTYAHPMYDRVSPVVIGGEYITTETGTGLVHTAPGHGQEDHATGVKFGLPLLSPVDDRGDFTEDAGASLVGKNVLSDGNEACVELLRAAGGLILREAYGHKYPYDWRTKKPTIFRATSQWFASVEGFRDDALRALDGVTFIPASGSKRMRPMVSGRNDWCISRQRAWGVPIPCFYREDGSSLMDRAVIARIVEIVREKGSDAWWELDVADLLPEEYKSQAGGLRKGTDTMDVWFDSGSSWNGVVKRGGLNSPADMYVEGSDQHRGWFQSSLLTSVGSNGSAPFKTVLTHGFVLDEKGLKMSKSLGNVVDPRLVIEGGANLKTDPAYGADILRLWVASSDYAGDVSVGPNVLKQTSEAYRKLRGTLRFLLGNLGDFDTARDAVSYDALPPFEKYALFRLAEATRETERAYAAYNYSGVVQTLQNFTAFLSNVFLDVSKDTLYVDAPGSFKRRAAQTVVAEVASRFLAALAPIAPHTAEEAHLAAPAGFKNPRAASVFLEGWPEIPQEWFDGVSLEELSFWKSATTLRGEVNRAIELARIDHGLGASAEAEVSVFVSDPETLAALKRRRSELGPFFIVSRVTIADAAGEVAGRSVVTVQGAEAAQMGLGEGGAVVGVAKTSGGKCLRCWGYFDPKVMGSSEKHPELCPRCTPVVLAVDPDMDARAIQAAARARAEDEAEKKVKSA